MRLGGSNRFDTSDVDADARRRSQLERDWRAALNQKQRQWALGYQSALEELGADITITDGIPVEVRSS